MCNILYDNINFKNSEHCYQYVKCKVLCENELTEKVKESSTAAEAKLIVNNFFTDTIYLEVWKTCSEQTMAYIL